MMKAARTQVTTFAVALDMFKADVGYYPKGTNGLNDLVVKPADARNWKQYMELIPLDPWQHPYILRVSRQNQYKRLRPLVGRA